MKLTLKIAVGVFLGILAAFCAIEAPSRIATFRATRLHIKAENISKGLTPLTLKANCGKPDKDELQEISVGHYERRMYYEKQGVSFIFADRGGYIRLDAPDEYKDWVSLHAANLIDSLEPEQALKLFPCLDVRQ